ncbi:DurN family substrate-assisted peptide maturase [Saccharopolyspora gloriosae]|uniref:DurN family substrate-assisted peptide maturase n=1 Tax=Saccharopolyspora gloriosae TaxID=455344 RepID=UPI001FB6C6B2|nr:DurN family substrate-assisted peptide maturase [Saccharopolyspora gloriosae]
MKHAEEPTIYLDVDAIRRIQELMVFCSLLPPDGKLREVLELALASHEEPTLSRLNPVTDLHPHATKAWLESLWMRDGLSPEEKEMVAWQNNTDNMGPALVELKNAERQLGIELVARLRTESSE